MWPDIEKVGLFERIPKVIEHLPRVSEKIRASHFFAAQDPYFFEKHNASIFGIPETDSEVKREGYSWLIWASTVAFAALKDSLKLDLNELRLYDAWGNSTERRDTYDNPLIAVLFELRNYEIHFEFRKVDIRDFQAYRGSDPKLNNYIFEGSIFISPIEFNKLSQLNNIKSGKSGVTASMVDWFNKQASTWPAANLIGTARSVLANNIKQFLYNNGLQDCDE